MCVDFTTSNSMDGFNIVIRDSLTKCTLDRIGEHHHWGFIRFCECFSDNRNNQFRTLLFLTGECTSKA